MFEYLSVSAMTFFFSEFSSQHNPHAHIEGMGIGTVVLKAAVKQMPSTNTQKSHFISE